MNSILFAKILSISISSIVLIILSLKKPDLSGVFESLSLFGIFLFALFIPIKDGFAIFGMVFSIIFFVAYRIARRDITIPKTPFNLPIIIYVFFVILSFFFTYSLKASINEGGEIVYFFMFYFAASELLNSERRIVFMLYTFAFSIAVAIFYGFFQGFLINALHSQSRVTGLIGNWDGFPVQISYGIVLFLTMFILNFNKINKKIDFKNIFSNIFSVIKKAVFLFFIVIAFIAVIFAKARSAWIGLIAGIFAVMLFKSRKVFLWTIIAAILLNSFALYFSTAFRSRVFAMFNPKILKCESSRHGDIESHIALIESAGKVFLRFPFTGVGVGAFSRYFDTHKDVHFPWYRNPKTGEKLYDTYDNWPENGYMQTLSETGVFSFIALMWLFFLVIKESFNLFRGSTDDFSKRIALLTGGVSLVFYGSFLGISNMSNGELTNLWLFFVAVFSAFKSIKHER